MLRIHTKHLTLVLWLNLSPNLIKISFWLKTNGTRNNPFHKCNYFSRIKVFLQCGWGRMYSDPWKRWQSLHHTLAWDTPQQHPGGQGSQGKLRRCPWGSRLQACDCNSWTPCCPVSKDHRMFQSKQVASTHAQSKCRNGLINGDTIIQFISQETCKGAW